MANSFAGGLPLILTLAPLGLGRLRSVGRREAAVLVTTLRTGQGLLPVPLVQIVELIQHVVLHRVATVGVVRFVPRTRSTPGLHLRWGAHSSGLYLGAQLVRARI